ncbi:MULTISPECIES: hypothetical protein [unclassified Frankia]|uniref:hypothetical protein n=1 Tax=unclassified Frankia TaxID=2632575 RepID=UPI002AD39008|nr:MULTISPECIES: hypothetical protein [unclassified Frankia]
MEKIVFHRPQLERPSLRERIGDIYDTVGTTLASAAHLVTLIGIGHFAEVGLRLILHVG